MMLCPAIFSGLSRRQAAVIASFALAYVFNAMCASMQAPFFPREAELKGCTPSQYGFVFGIFQLTMFVTNSIIGSYVETWGIKTTLNVGLLAVGVSCTIFGFLDKVNDSKAYLGLSLVLRVLEALGSAAYFTGSMSMIAAEFPSRVATMFAVNELFFGFGLIIGPTVGGALYQVGGFTLPFLVVGGKKN